MDRDKQAIDLEKVKANALETKLKQASKAVEDQKAIVGELDGQLETLSGQIDRARIYLDRTSQFEVDDFNRRISRYNAILKTAKEQNELANQMVDGYNSLLERYRAQSRVVNQMVQNYNAKLQQYGR